MQWTQLARRTFLALSGAALIVGLYPKQGLEIVMDDAQASDAALEPRNFDVVVVGGSFAGLSAALQIARTRRRVLVIDAGKPRNRFAAGSHGFLGQDGRTPAQIFQIGREQLLQYPTAEFVEGKAIHAERREDGAFAVTLASGDTYQSHRIILAVGVVDHLPEIPGVAERWGKTVNQCPYCHGYELAGGIWGVLYTGAASLHQVRLMQDWSDQVILFLNGTDQLNAEDRAGLVAAGITLEETPVEALVGETDDLRGIKLRDQRVVPIKALFLITRSSIENPLVAQLGCELEDAPFGVMIKTNELKETTVSGVFAAGDVARSLHNATWAASDGVLAGIFAHQSLLVHNNPYSGGS
ncbi:MAG: NAD(P)/FAD-dependent oxidoreductase [Cyanobacteria bacterium J06635_15]